MIERDEVIDRLQAGHRGLQISSDSRRDHIDAMEDLLLSFQEANEAEPTKRRVMPVVLRNAAILLVAFCLGIAGAATSDRVPGDSFYRAKRAAETPAQIVDRDIVASNRLGELEVLIDRRADPEIVLTARADAAEALFNRQSNDPMARALSLLAWPGGLAGRGVDVAAAPGGLLITEAEWSTDGGYTASLADGHLVNISSVSGDVLIGTTGSWTVFTTGTGWQLVNEDVNQVYTLQRQGDDFRVTAAAAAADPSQGDEVAGEGPNQTFERTTLTPIADADSDPNAGPINSDRPDDPGKPDAGSGSAGSNGSNPSAGPNPSSVTVPKPTTATPVPTTTDNGGSSPQTNPSPATNPPPTTTAATSSTIGPGTTDTTEGQTASTATPPTSAQTTTTAPVTTIAPTTTTQRTTTTTTAPQPTTWAFYLQNPGSGNTSSSANLPLSAGSAPSGSLANYDTDRDGDPGLMIQKDGAGLSGSDRSKTQLWSWTASSTTFSGEGSMTIWLAAKDFKTDERIGLLASLELCNPGCSRLGTGQWSGSGSSGFRNATISFGSINTTVPAGSTLRLTVVVPDSLATTDVWFAYDAGSYPSRLTIG